MTLVDIFYHFIADKEHVEHVQDLLDALPVLAHPSTHTRMSDWARATTAKTYVSEVASLSGQEHGLHYIIGVITEESCEASTSMLSAGAPCLWELIGSCLVADADLKSRRDKQRE